MDYKFAGDFTKAPLGPFTNANKKLVWPGLTDDFDPNGTKYEIVTDSRFPGGRACRLFYPKGQYGMQNQSYQVRIKSPMTIANIEWYWLFEPKFSFYSPVSGGDGGGGKLGPCINSGEIGGEESKRGTRAMYWWNSHGSRKDDECLNPTCQDQRSGNQLVQPVVYSKKIVCDKMYKFRIQMRGGPQPDSFVKYWITYPGEQEILFAEVKGKNLQASASDDIIFDFAYFSGGASPAYSPEWDSYARHGGIRYWSGSEYWAADAGNGGGDTIDGGGDTGPTPPSGDTSPYSLAVGETKIFRAVFLDVSVSPPKEVPAQAAVKWSLSPNNVSWGAEAGPNWSAIKVTGKTVGQGCVLVATDPATGNTTEPVKVDVTETPQVQPPARVIGTCTVEPLP